MQSELLAPAAALPAGYTTRPAEPSDAPAAAAAINAGMQALLGVNGTTADELEKEWQAPSFNLATDSCLLIAPDGTLAAYGSVWDTPPHVTPEAWGRVHPAHTGRGLGTYLMAWTEARAQQALANAPAGARVTLTIWINAHDTATHALLSDWGYAHVRSAYRMVIDLSDAAPPAPAWPEGFGARTFVLGQDDEELVRTVRASFADHWGYVERPFEEELENWRHNWATNPSFDPSLWSLAVTHTPAGEQIVGTSFARMSIPEAPDMGWIFALGVRRAWRRRGLAHALLLDSFNRLHARGRRRVGLGVDAGSLTGATRLYEKAGMRSDPQYTHQVWEKELRPGAELATTALASP
ncbi:MAG: GNAT family N-acetyltransferase [Anaerolineales bacterium]|nr:GNAT family N-acetyltransferase [Anaerolineales bacterium]